MLSPDQDDDKSAGAAREAFTAYMEKRHCTEIFKCITALLATQKALENASNDPDALKTAIATLLAVLQFENHGTYIAAAVNLTDETWQAFGMEGDLSPISNAKQKLENLSQVDVAPESDLSKDCLGFAKQAIAELSPAMTETWREFKLAYRNDSSAAQSKPTARETRQGEKAARNPNEVGQQLIETVPSKETKREEIHSHLTTPKRTRQTKARKKEGATREKHKSEKPSRLSALIQTLGGISRPPSRKPLIRIDVEMTKEEPLIPIVPPPEKEWFSRITWTDAIEWLNSAHEEQAQQCIAELLQFAKTTKADENVEAWSKLQAIAKSAKSIQEAIQANEIVNLAPLNDLLKGFAEIAFYDKSEAKLNLPTDTWLLLYARGTMDRYAPFDASIFHNYLTTSPLDNADLDNLNASLQRIAKFARSSLKVVDNMMEGVWQDFRMKNAGLKNK